MSGLARQTAKLAPATALDVARGVSRLMLAEGFSPIREFPLPNGRRLDVAAISQNGRFLGVEIKVSAADLKADDKWPDYLSFCDFFYFAVPPDFPHGLVPATVGLIAADRFGGAILRPAQRLSLHSNRRRALLLRFATLAAERLTRSFDPYCG